MDVPLQLQRFLDRLVAITPSGNGWLARCPAHADQQPSLSIGLGDGGCVLLNCHAGCDYTSVLKAIGFTPRDLFPQNLNGSTHTARRRSGLCVYATIEAAIRAACGPRHKFVESWPYEDAKGESLFHVCRYESATPPPDGQKPRKTFRPISLTNDGFVIRDPPGVLPLYRLPKLLVAQRDASVYFSEGEKKSEVLAALGLVATTTAHGSECPHKSDLSPLAGRDIVLLPDNDTAGEKYVNKLVRLLSKLLPQPTIRIVRFPNLPPKGDVVEFVSDRRAKSKSDAEIRAEIEQLAANAPTCAPPTSAPSDEPSTSPNSDPDRRRLTDTGNAERLADRHGKDLRWVHVWRKPLVWDRKRWRIDDLGRAMAFTKQVARSIYVEAANAENAHVAAALAAWANQSEAAARRKAMLDLIGSEDGIAIAHDALDTDPWLLNVVNGTLDLRTGQLREHRREDLISRIAPVAYDLNATAPTWMSFLERIQPDEEVRRFLQRAVGMSLTGDVSEQVLLVLFGLGANGKTVFLRTLQELFGHDYAHQAPTELLAAKRDRGHPTELADLFRRRLVVCTEIGSGLRFDEQLLKQLTGGDLITARRMKEDFWTFAPTHKLWVAGNRKPVIRGTDHAIWRRILLVPFTVTIPPGERDGKLLEKLSAELPGILNWAIDGCLLWQREGLQPPQQVLNATASYREEQDLLADFLHAECSFAPSAKVSAKDLYSAYLQWCTKVSEEPLSQRAFGMHMTDRGIERKKSVGTYLYFGIGLTPNEMG